MQIKNKKQLPFQIQKKPALLAAMVVVFVLLWQNSHAEDTTSSITKISQQQQSENEAKLEELNRRAQIYREIIEIKQKQQDSLNSQLSIMDSQIEQVETEIELNKRKISELDQKIKTLQQQIDDNEKTLKLQKQLLVELMKSYYENSQQNAFKIVFTSENFASFMSRKDQLSQTSQRIKEMVDSVTSLQEKLVTDREEFNKKRVDIVEAHYDLTDKNVALETTQAQKQDLLEQTRGEEERYQQLLIKTREQIQREIEKIELEKSGIDLGPLPPSKPGFFIYPVNPIVITQGYGKTSFSSNYASGTHNGIDFSVDYKSIYAAGDGKVLQTGDNGKYAYGKWVAISHGNGLVTLYGHFSKVLVGKGDKVKAGDVIGISGNTGFSTGPHLHFTVFAEKTFEMVESKIVKGLMLPTGVSINPKNYL